MTENASLNSTALIDLVAEIVGAYVATNAVPAAEIPGLIRSVHTTVADLASGRFQSRPEETTEKLTSARIRKSVMPGGIVSFIDGKTYQTLKRHLAIHGLDPQSYRHRFGLPADYPIVAADYAARRSELAKSIGLGRVGHRS